VRALHFAAFVASASPGHLTTTRDPPCALDRLATELVSSLRPDAKLEHAFLRFSPVSGVLKALVSERFDSGFGTMGIVLNKEGWDSELRKSRRRGSLESFYIIRATFRSSS